MKTKTLEDFLAKHKGTLTPIPDGTKLLVLNFPVFFGAYEVSLDLPSVRAEIDDALKKAGLGDMGVITIQGLKSLHVLKKDDFELPL